MQKALLVLFFVSLSANAAQNQATDTGIPLNSAWKIKAYDFAKKNLVHPAWGVPHSERNYHTATELAAKEKIALDEDVLFAASFLHDAGGFAPFAKEGVDHAVRSVEVVVPLLEKWGFPSAKIDPLKEMILGHVYYGPAPVSPQAQAFRDADILDFLGAIGIARILAITPETSASLNPTLNMARKFKDSLPVSCSLTVSRKEAAIRAMQMEPFFNALEAQGRHGSAL